MAIFFTSDLHFGHHNIIKYCNRPFANADAMGKELIHLWNDTVTEEDEVYVIGDFSMHQKAERIMPILAALRGTKHLIKGNHDDKRVIKKLDAHWASVNLMLDLSIEGQKVRLSHYPLQDWRGPRILLHGHSHNKNAWTGEFSRDVGVDANGYRPRTLEHLMNAKEAR